MKSVIEETVAKSNFTSQAAEPATDDNNATSKDITNADVSASSSKSESHSADNHVVPAPATRVEAASPNAVSGNLPSDLQKAAQEINREVFTLGLRTVEQLVEPIVAFRSREHQCALHAGQLDFVSRMNRWAAGRALIMVKGKLKHGEFEPWLEGHREQLGFGKSSAENYMNLARKFSKVECFLAETAPLREIYNRQITDNDDDSPVVIEPGNITTKDPSRACLSKAEALMKSLTNLQKRLRLVTESEEQLETHQINHLKLVKAEIDRFFNAILNPQPTK